MKRIGIYKSKVRMILEGLVVLAVATISPSVSLSSATYYVATNGFDYGPGTVELPWRTISYAAGSSSPVSAGDTVYVKQGIYNEHVTVMKSGSACDWITFAAYPGDTVTIDGQVIPLEAWEGLVEIRESIPFLVETLSDRSIIRRPFHPVLDPYLSSILS